MNEVVKTGEPVSPDSTAAVLELGKWMGRRDAFGLIAGRCSAADVESLRQIRDGKLYEHLNCSWEDFCTRHLRVTRRTIDREIAYLRRFGAAFFTVRQLTRISVKDYETIAGQITEEGVNLDGKLVPLDPENREALESALECLLLADAQEDPATPARPFDAVLERLKGVNRSMRALQGPPTDDEMNALAAELAAFLSIAQTLGLALVTTR